jgi:queuine tRNA-ribosyltransferase
LLTENGRVNIKNARFKDTAAPVDPTCDCRACSEVSAAYLHHLFHSRELLAYQLASIHNLRFTVRLMERMRAAIAGGAFDSFRSGFAAGFQDTDPELRAAQKRKWLEARARDGRS